MLMATDLVRRFRGMRVLVVGDVMLDSYFEGTAARLCAEGPVPVVRRTSEVRQPGGAGNTAANLAALGAEARLVGIVGEDGPGLVLREALRASGVSDEWLIKDDAAQTLHKLRILADGQYVVRFDEGDTSHPSTAVTERFMQMIVQASSDCDAILVSDYTFGAISRACAQHLSHLRYERDIPLVIDSKNLENFAGLGATVVTPNFLEASLLVHRSGPDSELDFAKLVREVLRRVGSEYAAVTLGKDGVLLAGRDGSSRHIQAHPVQRANDVGAGDTFAAALTLAIGCGAEMHAAVQIGIDAAAIVLSKPHTATVDYQELLQQVSLRDLSSQSETGSAALETLLERLGLHRGAVQRIVFTNGVFDILHAGHVEFLKLAKQQGDVLVVGINSDRSARNLKGRNRPINSERDRMSLIGALDSVDHTIIFDDDTPAEIIRRIRPDVHVKGGDYSGSELPEAAAVREYGGEVVILPLVGNLSTSLVIDRIVSLAMVQESGTQVASD
jgi:D-beta-D-heptose 7-phosphate kinase / D-beta-D-heptose 1-phosphate adenosyltransferase